MDLLHGQFLAIHFDRKPYLDLHDFTRPIEPCNQSEVRGRLRFQYGSSNHDIQCYGRKIYFSVCNSVIVCSLKVT
jgi:hypothetical protein